VIKTATTQEPDRTGGNAEFRGVDDASPLLAAPQHDQDPGPDPGAAEDQEVRP
jgi:hypothetical protein